MVNSVGYRLITFPVFSILFSTIMVGSSAFGQMVDIGEGVLEPTCFANRVYHPAYLSDWSFVNEKWRSDDKEYVIRERNVDDMIMRGSDVKDIVIKESKEIDNNGPNQLNVFSWAYASWRMIMTKGASFNFRGQVVEVGNMLGKYANGGSLEYDRIRFLVEYPRCRDQKLVPLGKRLLKARPDDWHVRCDLIALMEWSPKLSERLDALRSAEELSLVNSDKADLMAEGNMSLWFMTGQKPYATRAIEDFKWYASILPENDLRIAQANSLIKALEESLALKRK